MGQRDGKRILAIEGTLAVGTVEEFRDVVKGILSKGRPNLVIDLQQAEAVDSTGLGALAWAAAEARRAGGTVHVVRPNESVSAALGRSGLKRQLVCSGHKSE